MIQHQTFTAMKDMAMKAGVSSERPARSVPISLVVRKRRLTLSSGSALLKEIGSWKPGQMRC